MPRNRHAFQRSVEAARECRHIWLTLLSRNLFHRVTAKEIRELSRARGGLAARLSVRQIQELMVDIEVAGMPADIEPGTRH